MSDCGCDSGAEDSGGCDYGGDDSGGCDYGDDDSGGCHSRGDDSGGCHSRGDDSGGCDSRGGDTGSGSDSCCRVVDEKSCGGGDDSPHCVETQSATLNPDSFASPFHIFVEDPYDTKLKDHSTHIPMRTYTEYSRQRPYITRNRNRHYTSNSGGCDGDVRLINIVVSMISALLVLIIVFALLRYGPYR